MNTWDYFVLAVLGISAILGYYRGFLSVLGGFASTIIAIVTAVIYKDKLAVYLEHEFKLKTILVQFLGDKIPQPAWSNAQAGSLVPSIKTLPFVQEQLSHLGSLILAAISFILLFIIISKGLKLFFKLLEAPFDKGILGRINRLSGLALLLTKNLIIIAVIFGLVYPFVQNGADIGIKGFVNTGAWMEKSLTKPYLLAVYNWLQSLLGLGV